MGVPWFRGLPEVDTQYLIDRFAKHSSVARFFAFAAMVFVSPWEASCGEGWGGGGGSILWIDSCGLWVALRCAGHVLECVVSWYTT